MEINRRRKQTFLVKNFDQKIETRGGRFKNLRVIDLQCKGIIGITNISLFFYICYNEFKKEVRI